MAYLNWAESSVLTEVVQLSSQKTQLILILNQGQLENLVLELEQVYLNEEFELRLLVSKAWLLFWKKRDEGGRVILAHPQKDEWVGTIALDSRWGEQLLSGLKKIGLGEQLILSQLGSLSSVSNLDLGIRIN